MDLYQKCLLILKELFRQSGNSHWQNWIEQDIEEWDISIIYAIEANDIKIVENNNSMRPCPKCNSSDTCIYRWDIFTDENHVVVRRTQTNEK